MGRFISAASNPNINANLLRWLQAAAAQSPYDVRFQSGYRPGDPRFHGKQLAGDVQLLDDGRVIPNYQTASSFKAYQDYANLVRASQMASDPSMANQLRWGGYFSGGAGKYGALDLMHFDLGGDRVGMGGGSWAGGLTPEQAKIWGLSPGGAGDGAVVSSGIGDVLANATAGDKPFDISSGLSGLGSSSSAKAGPIGYREFGGDEETASPSPQFTSAIPADTRIGGSSAKSPAAQMSAPLAEIFKVGDIGTAGLAAAQQPYPARRKWA